MSQRLHADSKLRQKKHIFLFGSILQLDSSSHSFRLFNNANNIRQQLANLDHSSVHRSNKVMPSSLSLWRAKVMKKKKNVFSCLASGWRARVCVCVTTIFCNKPKVNVNAVGGALPIKSITELFFLLSFSLLLLLFIAGNILLLLL